MWKNPPDEPSGGPEISITSNKPQTTRNLYPGCIYSDEGQIVFLIPPGINRAKNKLGDYMLKAAEGTLGDVDVILLAGGAHHLHRGRERPS